MVVKQNGGINLYKFELVEQLSHLLIFFNNSMYILIRNIFDLHQFKRCGLYKIKKQYYLFSIVVCFPYFA